MWDHSHFIFDVSVPNFTTEIKNPDNECFAQHILKRGNFKELWRIWVFKIQHHENLSLNVSFIPSKIYFGPWESQLSTAPAVFTLKIRSRHQSRGKEGCCSHTKKNKVFTETYSHYPQNRVNVGEIKEYFFPPFCKREAGPGPSGWIWVHGGVGHAPETLGSGGAGTVPARRLLSSK